MSLEARDAIHGVRIRRLHKAMQALEAALSEGRSVSEALIQVSGLLDRGIDPRQIRSTFSDLPRLLALAEAIEAQALAQPGPDPRRPSRRVPV